MRPTKNGAHLASLAETETTIDRPSFVSRLPLCRYHPYLPAHPPIESVFWTDLLIARTTTSTPLGLFNKPHRWPSLDALETTGPSIVSVSRLVVVDLAINDDQYHTIPVPSPPTFLRFGSDPSLPKKIFEDSSFWKQPFIGDYCGLTNTFWPTRTCRHVTRSNRICQTFSRRYRLDSPSRHHGPSCPSIPWPPRNSKR